MQKGDYNYDIDNNLRKGEIVHTNHKLEFLRFFKSHKRLCDEISGLKYHVISNLSNEKILINKSNFGLAIKKLNSFIIDYIHYIEEYVKRNHIEKEFDELENEFNNDDEYMWFIKNDSNLSISNQIMFNKKYVYYLRRTFNVSHLLSQYLQNSLNIASREIIKNIQFVDYDGFFNNLSAYREEVSNDLSNLKFSSLFDNYKKLMGYFYTYRYLINKREQKHIVDLLDMIYNYLTLEDVIKFIISVNSDGDVNLTKAKGMREEFIIIRNAFNKVYYLCNYSLSLKNILPKSNKQLLIDNTLI